MRIRTSTRVAALALGAALIAAVALALSIGQATTSGQETAGEDDTFLHIAPPVADGTAGSQLSIEVRVEGVDDPQGLAAYEFALTWDPTVLTYNSHMNGPFLGSTNRAVSCFPAQRDQDGDTVPDLGYVLIGCATFAAAPGGPQGGGLLSTVTFDANCAGNTGISFSRVGLGDPLGDDIPAGAQGGSANITGAPACPTPTPRATSTPTPRPNVVGDVDCNGMVNSIDAALVLQFIAGLLNSLACQAGADANDDNSINSIDAALILQRVAGLINQLPP